MKMKPSILRGYTWKKYFTEARYLYESPSQLTVILTGAAAVWGVRKLWQKVKYYKKAGRYYERQHEAGPSKRSMGT